MYLATYENGSTAQFEAKSLKEAERRAKEIYTLSKVKTVKELK